MVRFVSKDGTVFTDRVEYRKYEMEKQYTFRNITTGTSTKQRGSIQGQPFNIIDCKDCTLIVVDHCDQVQIDNVVNANIFIGASCGSIFVRNCQDCSFTIACKQLRTRDCTDCTLHLHCKTEPIIETSTSMRFGPFNGSYPGHNEDLKAANLDKNKNLWYAVHDFNDEQKTGQNWSCIKGESSPWNPLGEEAVESTSSSSARNNYSSGSETTDESTISSNSEDSPRQGFLSSIFGPSSDTNNNGDHPMDTNHSEEQNTDLSPSIFSKAFIFTFIYSFIQQSYSKATMIWNQITQSISGWFPTR